MEKAKIVKFLYDGFWTNEPGTHTIVNLYEYEGEIVKTLGSQEFRDDDHKFIGAFDFYGEFAPYSRKAIADMVDFQNSTI